MIKKIIYFIIAIALVVYYSSGYQSTPAEKINVIAGIGGDFIEDEDGDGKYVMTVNSYTFNKEGEMSSMLISGEGNTIADMQQNRQLKNNGKTIAGVEKVIILGEELARKKLETSIDVLFANPVMNDLIWVVVCKGEAKELLEKNIADYPSVCDYLEDMIVISNQMNFMSNNYKLIDLYVRIDAEGRNVALPYVEYIDDKLEITGMAIFNKYKMVAKIDKEDMRLMNMMREKKSQGILEIRESADKYTSAMAKVKRKVKVKKEKGKYKFEIKLDVSLDIMANSLYPKLESETKVVERFQKDMESKIKRECMKYVKKMQTEIKADCLELGFIACAKYGRNKIEDWSEVIAESEITVKPKVTVKTLGRGRYYEE